MGSYSSLVLDATDVPAIAYYDASAGHLKYAVKNGAVWTITVVDNAPQVGKYASLQLKTPAGPPAVAYDDEANTAVKYAIKNGAAWQVQTVDPNGNVGEHTALAFDGAGNPWIAYRDAAPSYDLKLAQWTGAWTIKTVDASPNMTRNIMARTEAIARRRLWNRVRWTKDEARATTDVAPL